MGRVRSGREIDAALRKKGFRRDSSGDHLYYFFTDSTGLELPINTKMSHGMLGSTIDVKTLALMSRQLHLTKSQFLDFIDCTLSESGFRDILNQLGLV
ncbi:MAG: hypothetical protein ACRC10_12490 [Thermoguttaceae bacterium]